MAMLFFMCVPQTSLPWGPDFYAVIRGKSALSNTLAKTTLKYFNQWKQNQGGGVVVVTFQLSLSMFPE